jgi:DNA phosphorothioation-dependent restriction protein DptG
VENHELHEERLDIIRDITSQQIAGLSQKRARINPKVLNITTDYLSVFTALSDEPVSLGERAYLATQEVNAKYEKRGRVRDRGVRLAKALTHYSLKASASRMRRRHGRPSVQ